MANKVRKIELQAWQEIVGVFKGLIKSDTGFSVLVADYQVILSDTAEAKIIEEELNDTLIGVRLSILKTELPNKPVILKLEAREGIDGGIERLKIKPAEGHLD